MRRAACLAVLAAIISAACGSPAGHDGGPVRSPSPRAGSTRLVISPARFRLPAPVQREVAAVHGSSILLAGGLNVADASTDGVFSLDPRTGRVQQLGTV